MTARKSAAVTTAKGAVTLTHGALSDLLTPVLPHADTGGSLPILGCVKLEVVAGFLTATATDRYTFGICRTPVPAGTEFAALVHAVELRALLAMFKPRRRVVDQSITLTVDGALMVAEGGGVLFSNARITYDLYQGDYPVFAGICSSFGKPSAPEPVSIAPAHLARFSHAARARAPLTLHRNTMKDKPLFVTAGDHFLGAVMPVRAEEGAQATDWLGFLGVTLDESVAL